MKDLSIIIVSYNTKEITKKCLETINESLSFDPTIRVEIIVLDNASKDGSVEEIQNTSLKLIALDENIGFGRGNNRAVKEAEGKYLLFLNSDIEVLKDAIPKMYNYFVQKENPYNFLGAKLLNKDFSLQPSCGPFYTLPVVFGALFLKGDYWGLTRYSPTTVKEVDWVSGACFMCSKKDFLEIGQFDEKIFMYMEEIDLFYRAKKMGLSVGFTPFARFIHLGSASSKNKMRPMLNIYKGFLYFYKKHYSPFQVWILRNMLKLKSICAIWIGKLTRNPYLIATYEQAYTIAQNH